MSKRATFTIAAIHLTCPCGGHCVTSYGSYMIIPDEEEFATCDRCGKKVKIPKAAKK